MLFSELLEALPKSFVDLPAANVLEHVFDVKTWLSPHLNSLHNHTHPHVFWLRKGITGAVEMHYKHYSDSPWEPTGPGLALFKVSNL